MRYMYTQLHVSPVSTCISSCALFSAHKMADHSKAYRSTDAVSLQRSLFRKNPLIKLIFVICWVGGIICGMDRPSRKELKRRLTDRQTDRQTQLPNPRCACAPGVYNAQIFCCAIWWADLSVEYTYWHTYIGLAKKNGLCLVGVSEHPSLVYKKRYEFTTRAV